MVVLARVIATLLFATAVGVFAVQNGQAVELRLFSWRASVSLALVLLGALTVGAVAVGVPGFLRLARLSRRLREQAERVRRLEAELAAARQAGPAPGEGMEA